MVSRWTQGHVVNVNIFLFSKSLKVKSDDDTKMTEYVLADKLIELTFGICM